MRAMAAAACQQPNSNGNAGAFGMQLWFVGLIGIHNASTLGELGAASRRTGNHRAADLGDGSPLCRTQKRFRHDSRIAARSRLSDSFPLDAYTHAPHGATKAARPLR